MEYDLRVAVCDDIAAECEEIASTADRILRESNIVHNITCYQSGNDLLCDIKNGIPYHILILDVLMKGMGGIALAVELRAQGNQTSIILVSANREMALLGYEVSAQRFLAKPLDEEKLKEALLHCYRVSQAKKALLIPTDNGEQRVSLADIRFVEAYDRGTRFVLSNETVESKLKLCDARALLPAATFLLCHRAYIVNLACVKYLRPYEFLLKSGEAIPIGKGRYQEVRRRFASYIAD